MSQADDSGAADGEAVPDYPGLLRLDGRRFVVLGAGQGTGRQAAHALASVGARVACVDLEGDRAATVAAEVDGLALVGDMTKRADVERVVDETSRTFAGLDGIVDIIGMARYSSLLELSDEEWDWHFDVVLRHAYLAAQVGGRALLGAGGGTLVFVASVSGLTSAPRHAAYGAAKAGLMSLTRTAAVELGPAGVRVERGCSGRRVDAEGLGVPRGRGPRPQRGERPAAPDRVDVRHRCRHPLPLLRSGGLHHGADARRRRRCEREVPVPDGRRSRRWLSSRPGR